MPGQKDFFANYREPNQMETALIVAGCALDGIEDTLTRVGADDFLRQLYRGTDRLERRGTRWYFVPPRRSEWVVLGI